MALTKITSDVIGSGAIESGHIASGAIGSGHLTNIDTDNVSEGSTNTYFTNARARGSISVTGGNLAYDNSTGVLQLTDSAIEGAISTLGAISTGNITTTGYLRGPSTFTIDPAAHGDNTGTLVIAGNLQVDGTTTTINSTTLTVDDKNIVLASGAANAAAANGAGITVDGASATITYDGTNDEWDFNKDINVTGTIKATGTTPAVQIGDTNGYTFYYTGNSSNRLQLNYDAPLGSGSNILMEADSSGRIVFPDKVALAATYGTASGSSLSSNSYLYVGSSNDTYNLSLQSSRDITDTAGAWSARNELFIYNTHSGGEASIGLSTNGSGGQHHRAAIIATEDGTSSSTGKLAFKTRGSSAAESEKERLTIYKDGMIEMVGTKAYGSDLGLLRLRPSFTGTNYSDGAKLNLVFGHEAVTNSYIGEIRVTQTNPSVSTASTMEFFTNSGGGNSNTEEAMRIDSSGNLILGKTNTTTNNTAGIYMLASGAIVATRNSDVSALFNRTGTDGQLVLFRKDNTTVGQINSLSGRVAIGSGNTGLFFDSIRQVLTPHTMSGNTYSTTIDIGRSAIPFQHAHFSGQVNAATLTATNTADATGLSFRSGNEYISGEGWCTAHGQYNYNDGTLFLNRDTSNNLRPVFHIGGYNNSSYHPAISYSVGEAGMVTLTKPNGTKSEGSTYAAKGLSNGGDYSNWIKDGSKTVFYDSDNVHEFHNRLNVRGNMHVNSDKVSNQYLHIWQAVGGDGGLLFGDATSGSRYNWQQVPSTTTRDMMFYSYTGGYHTVKFGPTGGIRSLADGGTSSAFFLAGETAAAANGKVAMGLRDGMIQFRDPLDYYHKMWYYDGVNVSTNQGHGHFRVWGDSDNSAMTASGAENTLRFSIDTVTGNIGTSDGATNIYNASDERIKENITTLPSMLGKIKDLRPISYDWKYKEGETGIYGFIAQEVQDVDASLVFNSGPTGYRNDKTYGEDLELDGTIEDTLAINERKLFPMLVKAIQEQQTIIDDLKTRIETLEG